MAILPNYPKTLTKTAMTKMLEPLTGNKTHKKDAKGVLAHISNLEKSFDQAVKQTGIKESQLMGKIFKVAKKTFTDLQSAAAKSKDAKIKKAADDMKKVAKDFDTLQIEWDRYTFIWKNKQLGALPNLKKNYFAFAKSDKNSAGSENLIFLEAVVKAGGNPKKLYKIWTDLVNPATAKIAININGNALAGWKKSVEVIGQHVKPNPNDFGVDGMQAIDAAKAMSPIIKASCKEVLANLDNSMQNYARECRW